MPPGRALRGWSQLVLEALLIVLACVLLQVLAERTNRVPALRRGDRARRLVTTPRRANACCTVEIAGTATPSRRSASRIFRGPQP